MKPIRITAVSYLNTLPLIYGITHSGLLPEFSLELRVPSACAEQLLNGQTDLSLVPVGALPLFPTYNIVGNYCIGAIGNVRTVLLLSNQPVEELHTIYLDTDSRTSVSLIKVLAKHLWKVNILWKSLNGKDSSTLSKGEGVVLIGDKTFGVSSKFKFSYDLAGAWYSLTHLPFVFAAWVAVNPLPGVFEKQFESALKWGTQHIHDSVRLAQNHSISKEELISYLSRDISFLLDDEKKKGMNLFLKYLIEKDF